MLGGATDSGRFPPHTQIQLSNSGRDQNKGGVTHTEKTPVMFSMSGPELMSSPVSARKVTVESSRLSGWDKIKGQKPPSILNRMSSAIMLLARNIKNEIVSTFSTFKTLVAGALGSAACIGLSIYGVASTTGGLSMATLIPTVVAGSSAAPVGFFAGALGGILGGTLYGAGSGIVKTMKFLCRTPEQRFLQSYKAAIQALEYFEQKESENQGPLSDSESIRMQTLREYIDVRKEECSRLLKDQDADGDRWQRYGFHPGIRQAHIISV